MTHQELKIKIGSSIRKGTLLRSAQEPLKNTPAAEKMAHPVARSNRVDGRGRGVKRWGRETKSPKNGIVPKCWMSCLNVSPNSQAKSSTSPGDYSRYPNSDGNNTSYTPPQISNSLNTIGQKYTPQSRRILVFLLLLLYPGNSQGEHGYAHQPYKWTLSRWEDQQNIQTINTPGAPSFTPALCQLVPIKPCLNLKGFYFCPSSNPGKGYCNHPNTYYCAYWGCETVASDWSPGGGKDRHITVGWGPFGCTPPKRDSSGGTVLPGDCGYIYINISNPSDPGWIVGKTWGMRYWEPGTDRGGLILIRKEVLPNDPIGVGPNSVLTGEVETEKLKDNATTGIISATSILENEPQEKIEDNSLWKLVQARYQVLKATSPNLTEPCWLCYDIKPPFYEAIGVTSKFKRINGSNPAQCLWGKEMGQRQGMTLSQVSGKGRCLGKIPLEKDHLCGVKTSLKGKPSADWLIPARNTKWICSKTGITPCLSLRVFNESDEYCIQVIIVPKIIYHPESFVYDYQTVQEHHLQKREPFTALTIGLLMAAGAAGTGTGIASLVQQDQKFRALRVAVDEDLVKIEKSISALESSLRSLSEVVLQNRRGLDLMFLQQGGLCAALREECCVYADHTGVVRDTMTKLREGLEKRKKEREMQQNWYESWFNHSPWLTTLLSTIPGPLILLVLGLTFGPCIFNRLTTIVKGRLEAAHLMLIRSQYEQLREDKLQIEEASIFEKAKEVVKRFDEQNVEKKKGGL